MNQIDPDLLISEGAANFTNYIYSQDNSFEVFVNRDGGSVEVGGGYSQQQTINSVAIPLDDQVFIEDLISELNNKLAVNFSTSHDSDTSDISFTTTHLSSLIHQNSSYLVLLFQIYRAKRLVELFVNEPAFDGNTNHLRYALLHELGHALDSSILLTTLMVTSIRILLIQTPVHFQKRL